MYGFVKRRRTPATKKDAETGAGEPADPSTTTPVPNIRRVANAALARGGQP